LKKIFALFAVLLVFSFAFAQTIEQPQCPTGTATVYLFWGNGCPHCAAEKQFLQEIGQKYPGLQIKQFEVWYDAQNSAFYKQVADAFGTLDGSSVPRTFVADKVFVGFAEEQGELIYLPEEKAFLGYKNQIEKAIEEAMQPGAATVEQVLEGKIKPAHAEPDSKTVITLPFFGEIDASQFSLPVFTVIMGLIDGFNACAMFVLLMLLAMLVRLKSRRRMALVAGTFVFVSGAVYFLFMSAWLNVFEWIGSVAIAFSIVGLIALAIGFVNLKDFFFFKKGPSLSIPKRFKPKVFAKMREILEAESVPLMIGAAIVLAISVNFVEFLCTFGLPMVYTKVLAEQQLPALTKYLYLALYQVFYMLDDAIITAIVVITLSSRKVTEKYGRVLKFIAGAIMLALGAILLLNPGLLVLG